MFHSQTPSALSRLPRLVFPIGVRGWLVAGIAVLLAACGGGGGGGESPPPTVPAPTNAPPTISGSPVESIRAGSEYAFAPQATDPDGDTLSFTIANAPWWTQFNSATGTLSGFALSSHVGQYEDIVISVSDGTVTRALPPFTLTVLPQLLTSANFITEGVTTPTVDGYLIDGDLVLDTGERQIRLEDSDLALVFDDDGLLIDLYGEASMPRNPIDNVTIDSAARAVVGLMTGAQINADEDFGIVLQEETRYLVFLLSVAVDMTITNPNDASIVESVTLDLPVDGRIVLISDLTDPFLYRYGEQALVGGYGYGFSYNGLIPFVPELPHPQLAGFNGHELERGTFDIGWKVFDFFTLTGTRVTRNAQFLGIDWDDPFKSPFDYATGMNGDAEFAFSVLSVGLFSFDLAHTSATMEVTRQDAGAAMMMRIAPDVSWVPDWFPFVPSTEVVGEWSILGDTVFAASLSGGYQSTVPPADVTGTIAISNERVLLAGTTTDDAGTLTLSAEFANQVTTLRVDLPANLLAGLDQTVLDSLDQELAARVQALAELEAAIEGYEFELSLRGLRPLLAGIADTAITELNAIPAVVRTAAYNATVSYIENTCTTVLGLQVCLDDVPGINKTSIATSVGNEAHGKAVTEIAPYVSSMQNLKTQAQAADSEALRTALRNALQTAYDNEVVSVRVQVSYLFPSPFGLRTVYDSTHTRRVIPVATANQIQTAANNVHLIGETSNIMISAEAVFNAFPAEEVFAQIRQEVEDGVAQIPAIEGLGATIAGGTVEAFVTFDDSDHPVGFNVLKPSEVLAGVAGLVTHLLLGNP
jgi:hypothetical protein